MVVLSVAKLVDKSVALMEHWWVGRSADKLAAEKVGRLVDLSAV